MRKGGALFYFYFSSVRYFDEREGRDLTGDNEKCERAAEFIAGEIRVVCGCLSVVSPWPPLLSQCMQLLPVCGRGLGMVDCGCVIPPCSKHEVAVTSKANCWRFLLHFAKVETGDGGGPNCGGPTHWVLLQPRTG